MRDRIPQEFLRSSGTLSRNRIYDTDDSLDDSGMSGSSTSGDIAETVDISGTSGSGSSSLYNTSEPSTPEPRSYRSNPHDISETSSPEPRQFAQLQRIARPDALAVTYKYRGDQEGRDMILFHWTRAGTNQHAVVGDLAQQAGEMIRVYDNGGFEDGVVDYIVFVEIEVARRKSMLVVESLRRR